MTRLRLALRSLRFHARSLAGVLAGSAVASAVLIGALLVGDSVRGTLADGVRERLGFRIAEALDLRDRFVTTNLALAIRAQFPDMTTRPLTNGEFVAGFPGVAGELALPGTVSRQDGTARANQVRVHGITPEFSMMLSYPLGSNAPVGNQVWLGEGLSRLLHAKVGDELVLRIHRPSALSRDAVITPREDQSVALRVTVSRILGATEGGGFGLQSGASAPLNAFVSYETLASAAGLPGRVNLLVGDQISQLREPKVSQRILHRLRSGVSGDFSSSLTGVGVRLDPGDQNRAMNRLLAESWVLGDAELTLAQRSSPPGVTPSTPGFLELTSRRIFLDPPVTAAASDLPVSGIPATPLVTYLVNAITAHDGLAPYSMVTAAGPPYTPADLRDDEILVNAWLAEDLGVRPGDTVQLAYYRADSGPNLVERTNTFRVRGIVPLSGWHADRTLMPEFPGLAKAESTRDWDAGFELVHRIRDKDEAYWKQWRGTPKAFINLAAGQRLWGNRFGDLTSVRWFLPEGSRPGDLQDTLGRNLRDRLKPDDLGLVWQPVAERARSGAASGQDFGGLFIGFSFFLIVAALLLTAMLFQFSLDRRTAEVGVLLALGWPPRQVRRVFLLEGVGVAVLGSILGALLGTAYAQGIVWGLNHLWSDAVSGTALTFHGSAGSILSGMAIGLGVAAATLAWSLRGLARQPARELLNESSETTTGALQGPGTRRDAMLATLTGAAALALCGAGFFAGNAGQAGLFFGAGAAALISGSLWIRRAIRAPWRSGRSRPARSVRTVAYRGISRRPSRSLSTILLLACAAFLLVVVAANRLDSDRDAWIRGSGTGGFALWGESALPVTQDLNQAKGREFYGLDPKDWTDVSVVPFRVRDGDDASCLNLNRAQRPRLLGVQPGLLAERGAFTFVSLSPGLSVSNGWQALQATLPVSPDGVPEIPAIGDANSIQWALGKKIGETLEVMDERGRTVRLRLVGSVANSILQGSLVVSEDDFVRLYPSESGHRAFLVDTPRGAVDAVAATLSRSLSDVGLETIPASERLARFNAVQNTYLNTFQVLGGLGLLLGSVGLGILVLRNVQDRRGELALMEALGFEPSAVRRMVLVEHLVLLGLGLGLGVAAALLAVLPSLLRPGSGIPWGSLATMLGLVAVNGVAWTWVSTRCSLRRDLLGGLREL